MSDESGIIINSPSTNGGGGGPPTGVAGGDLEGTYPNPSVIEGAGLPAWWTVDSTPGTEHLTLNGELEVVSAGGVIISRTDEGMLLSATDVPAGGGIQAWTGGTEIWSAPGGSNRPAALSVNVVRGDDTPAFVLNDGTDDLLLVGSTGAVTISPSDDVIAQIVNAAAGQTENIAEWQLDGTPLAWLEADGTPGGALAGGGLPGWWTVDSTPGQEQLTLNGGLRILTPDGWANDILLDVGNFSGDNELSVSESQGLKYWSGGDQVFTIGPTGEVAINVGSGVAPLTAFNPDGVIALEPDGSTDIGFGGSTLLGVGPGADFSGDTGVRISDVGAVTISPSDPDATPLLIQGTTGQNFDLLSVNDEDGTGVLGISSRGAINVAPTLDIGSPALKIGPHEPWTAELLRAENDQGDSVLAVGPTGAVTISPSEDGLGIILVEQLSGDTVFTVDSANGLVYQRPGNLQGFAVKPSGATTIVAEPVAEIGFGVTVTTVLSDDTGISLFAGDGVNGGGVSFDGDGVGHISGFPIFNLTPTFLDEASIARWGGGGVSFAYDNDDDAPALLIKAMTADTTFATATIPLTPA